MAVKIGPVVAEEAGTSCCAAGCAAVAVVGVLGTIICKVTAFVVGVDDQVAQLIALIAQITRQRNNTATTDGADSIDVSFSDTKIQLSP